MSVGVFPVVLVLSVVHSNKILDVPVPTTQFMVPLLSLTNFYYFTKKSKPRGNGEVLIKRLTTLLNT